MNPKIFGDNLLTTNARRSTMGSKDADFCLVCFKGQNKEIAPCISSRAPMTSSQNPLTPPTAYF